MKWRREWVVAAFLALVVVWGRCAALGSCPQVGNGPGHLGVASGGGPAQLSSARFTITGRSWVTEAGVAVGSGEVVALARGLDGQNHPCTVVVAVSERTGQVIWTSNVPPTVQSSWSQPAIDEQNQVVVVAAGNQLIGLSTVDGQHLWSMPAQGSMNFVDACPTMADGIVYIVDYVSQTDLHSICSLYAVNVVTGQLAWSAPVGRTSGGCTAAVSGGKVMVATNEGKFLTFDRVTGTAYPPLVLNAAYGFFGGVAAEGNYAYTVSFAYGDDRGPTKLYKIDISNSLPAVVWESPAPRTDTIPLVVGNLVLVSGGDGYLVFMFSDWPDLDWPGLWAFDKSTGQLQWQTDVAGGWTSQPLCANGIVYAVSQATDTNPTTGLYALDISKAVDDPAFVVASTGQIGNSVAVASGNVYGTSSSALKAFGPAVLVPGDIDGDGHVTLGDLKLLVAAWNSTPASGLHWNPAADLDGSGAVNLADLKILVANWNKY